MAKRAIILTVAFLLLAVPLCFAQPRAGIPADKRADGLTTFAGIEVTGLEQGAPGYIALMGDDASTIYYLWVDSNGALRLASQQPVSVTNSDTDASPPMTSWTDNWGPKVGNIE